MASTPILSTEFQQNYMMNSIWIKTQVAFDFFYFRCRLVTSRYASLSHPQAKPSRQTAKTTREANVSYVSILALTPARRHRASLS